MGKKNRKHKANLALAIIVANKDFFLTPLLDQEKILEWLEQAGEATRDALREVSQKLDEALTDKLHHSVRSNYFDALTGSMLPTQDGKKKQGLQHGITRPLKELLEKKPSLSKTIIEISESALLSQWNAYQDRLMKRNAILMDLENQLGKTQLSTLFKQRCLTVCNQMKQGKGFTDALSKIQVSPYYEHNMRSILEQYSAFKQLRELDSVSYQDNLQKRIDLLRELETHIVEAPHISGPFKARCLEIIKYMKQGKGFSDALSIIKASSPIKQCLCTLLKEFDAFGALLSIDQDPLQPEEAACSELPQSIPASASSSSSYHSLFNSPAPNHFNESISTEQEVSYEDEGTNSIDFLLQQA